MKTLIRMLNLKKRADLSNRVISIVKDLRQAQEPEYEDKTQDNVEEIKLRIIQFLKKNQYPTDAIIHKFAEQLNMSPDKLETIIYSLLTDYVTGNRAEVTKHALVPDDKFDPEQLKMGIEIEKEHTDNEKIAKEIAKDHLAENAKYYTYLKKMEESFSGEGEGEDEEEDGGEEIDVEEKKQKEEK